MCLPEPHGVCVRVHGWCAARLPDTHGEVTGGGGDGATLRTEGDVGDPAVVPVKGELLLAVAQAPQLGVLVVAARDHHETIAVEDRPRHPVGMASQREEAFLLLPPPHLVRVRVRVSIPSPAAATPGEG
eukprot:scaffold39789_cov61-Phaeocystis_antarctica.AAC.1